jgi:16S rRNA (uracil1498-N3)-methyltransferase
MAIHDFTSQRLYVREPLSEGERIACSSVQANYLLNVLRMKGGDGLLVFNGRDGEWRVQIADVRKKACVLHVLAKVRPQAAGPDVDLLFAPLKHARLDYMVQKAVEMGVRRLRPVMTRRTIADRVNLDRMMANAIEAAEQCGILHTAEILPPASLDAVLLAWEPDRRLVFCDEGAGTASPVPTLSQLLPGPISVIIGPEGGFDSAERSLLCAQPFVVPVSLGPRIMRADTAAVAALALVNAVAGRGW